MNLIIVIMNLLIMNLFKLLVLSIYDSNDLMFYNNNFTVSSNLEYYFPFNYNSTNSN